MLSCVSLSKHSKATCSQFPVFVLTLLTLSLVFLLSAGKAYPGQATLSWDPPTTNVDDTPLTDLAGYKVYYGTSSGNYTQNINAGNVTTYTVTNLTDGLTYYFVVTAYDTFMNESGYSNEVSKTITLKTYTITASAGSGGTIKPSGTVSVNHGASQAFTITANSGYSIANVLVDGTSVGAVSIYTFSNVTTNHTISASFTMNTFNLAVTKSGTGAGTVTSSPAGISCGSDCAETYSAGTSVTLTASASASSTFAGWSGACTGTGSCSVTMNAAKAVTSTFTLKTYTITASAGSGGTIKPSGTVSVNHGASQAFTITADTEYSLADVKVDNVSEGALSGYTFTNVTNNHSIEAIFAMDPGTGSVDLPKTGQTISYVPGDDGYIQAGVEWPNPRFTNNGDGTVTDNLTGLIWLKDAGCIKNSWSNALNAIADFNNKPENYDCLEYAAKYFDWRLPNVKELESLINYGAANPAVWLNSEGFVDVKSSYYWSSTTYPSNTSQAWLINIYNGTEKFYSKLYWSYILPVRTLTSDNPYELPKTGQIVSYASGDDGYIQAGVEWPNPRFTNNGDGTVTDNLTGLIWLKDAGCIKNSWSNALNAIADFNNKPENYDCLEYAANYSDWRLPNVKELESLINYGAANPAVWLNSEGFVDVKSSYYWSSTTYPKNASQAWVINMTKGDMIPANKNYNYYISPVR